MAPLQGWQFQDSDRSSWDIVWTCLTTIFACTWTILHQNVPPRSASENLVTAIKLVRWTMTFLAPELLFLVALNELWSARSLARRCNAAQERTGSSNSPTGEPTSWLYNRTRPLSDAHAVDDMHLYPLPARWTVAHCFCVQMNGVTLETEDGWIFYVREDQIVAFIEAGVMRSPDFTDRDITYRAKSDAFAKAFTIFQSTWVIVNIVARAGYNLPITPLEFSTLAYVACALMTYACWWNKPQGMAVPITLFLQALIQSLTDAFPERWEHCRVFSRGRVSTAFRRWGTKLETEIRNEPAEGGLTRGDSGQTTNEESFVNTASALSGLVFCGLHVAAWNFPFPTRAEAIAWRVFALTGLGSVAVVYVVGQAPVTLAWLREKGATLPRWIRRFGDLDEGISGGEMFLSLFFPLLYVLARLGLAALTLSSLRALPAGCYTAVVWVESIPHI
ncbi:hypothetical protein ASPVEDRAFT_56117 [Aspergillus versicolor CBS 583.65]|uniref:Uncharacterized protein n=1 Tax=Aspergillus versicolor CBS 583.65 TaxID=1036611 RepID=A0A1L9PYA1_ASPVE|nr:uncharacterized protein ASPVEDRAFT_56117 [Aspergillus versicolor CBS 583.65]OJJ06494.1 hypothetical protein ASPVEDRAFT_56117 [Aspergillus versicolor CBS 583.65]